MREARKLRGVDGFETNDDLLDDFWIKNKKYMTKDRSLSSQLKFCKMLVVFMPLTKKTFQLLYFLKIWERLIFGYFMG